MGFAGCTTTFISGRTTLLGDRGAAWVGSGELGHETRGEVEAVKVRDVGALGSKPRRSSKEKKHQTNHEAQS